MVTKSEAGAIVIGTTIGSAQTPLLREYVDKKYPDKRVEMLKGFGTPSSLTGTSLGFIATVAGLVGVVSRKGITKSEMQAGALSYGLPALVGGVLSGVFPAIPITPAAGAGRLTRVAGAGGRVIRRGVPAGEGIVTPPMEVKYRGIV